MKENYEQLLSVIGTGEENAIHLEDLENLLNANKRTVKSIVQAARENGLFILSSEKGYFFPATVREAHSFIKYEKLRRQTNKRQCRLLEAYLKNELKGADPDNVFPVKYTKK